MQRDESAHSILSTVAHRPWPLPKKPWVMRQTWATLLFAHWPVPRELMAGRLPPPLVPDTFEGQAWLGVTPFRVRHLRVRGGPGVPTMSTFPELNVRTYVTVHDKPGVFFFSLDVTSTSAALGAGILFRLPYFRARMSVKNDADHGVEYSCRRIHGPTSAHFRARYGPQPQSPKAQQDKDPLAYFLTERYCLYVVDKRGGVWRGQIHHEPWPLQQARASIEINTMAAAAGIELPSQEPLLHYADKLPVLIWPLERA